MKNRKKKILIIRIQAFGDVLITLPYIKGLGVDENVKLQFLTRGDNSLIPSFMTSIEKVWKLKGEQNRYIQFAHSIWLAFLLRFQNFDQVIDLQNNSISKGASFLYSNKNKIYFDRFSPKPAGTRTLNAFHEAGYYKLKPKFERLTIPAVEIGITKWNEIPKTHLKIVINPAGFYKTRNWPVAYYIKWCEQIIKEYQDVRFIFIGLERIKDTCSEIEKVYGPYCVNLINETSQAQAFKILQEVDFILTEDSALMHMAWTSGIPTLAIFGSTRHDWSQPLGSHSYLFHSGDLECGDCMKSYCKFGDNRCLTRWHPNLVFEKSKELISV